MQNFLEDTSASGEVPAEFEEAAFQLMTTSSGAEQADIWLQEPILFMDIMSTINVVKNDDAGGFTPERRAEALEKHNGSNKDRASSFMAACRNVALGCGYATGSGGNLVKHQKKCPFGYVSFSGSVKASQLISAALRRICDHARPLWSFSTCYLKAC